MQPFPWTQTAIAQPLLPPLLRASASSSAHREGRVLRRVTSDLAVDPPEVPLGHAVDLDQDLTHPAWLQGQDELLLQLPDAHTGRG